MLEELGVPYEYHFTKPREGTRTPEFLALYPGGTVPVIDDDGFVLAESVAINFYLAEKYNPAFMGRNLQERALVYQWSLWAMTNLQHEVLTLMFAAMSPGARDEKTVATAETRAAQLLAQLDGALHGHEYLVGDQFSAADVNAGSVVNIAHAIGRLTGCPNVTDWITRLKARPAFQKILAAAKEK
jgi:glutathione S-transferase